jgi:hypothetical protein
MFSKLFRTGQSEPSLAGSGRVSVAGTGTGKGSSGRSEMEKSAMSEDMITPENQSIAILKAAFDAAYMDVSLDKDGELKVKDACTVFVKPDLERKNLIRLESYFAFTEGSAMIDRLKCVNQINQEYLVVCASTFVNDDDDEDIALLTFRYDLLLDGGMTKKALVLGLKRFAAIPHQAIQEYGGDIVE